MLAADTEDLIGREPRVVFIASRTRQAGHSRPFHGLPDARAQCPLPTGATQAATVTPKCFRVVSEPRVTPVKYPDVGATSA